MTDVLRVRILPHGEGLDFGRATKDAAGLDLRAALPEGETMHIAPRAHAAVPAGIALAIPPGCEGQVRPRSGLARDHGVTVLNSPGTIDADYRGEIVVLLINHGKEPFAITRGMRIAQLVIARVESSAIEIVEALDETGRGSGGFGSTGRA